MSAPRWTVVIAYYNEAGFLADTLASLDAQTLRPFRLILVDNGSTDGSAAIAREAAARMADVETIHLSEARPGKIFALETADPHIATEFVAFADADTFYPPHYLAAADAAYRRHGPGLVAAMATPVGLPITRASVRLKRAHGQIVSRIWPKQTHVGGYGQTFRTAAYRAAGGYSHAQWPYVLMDHEIMERIVRQGRTCYPYDLWCSPSPRRADRTRVRWTLPERLLYHFSPAAAKPWFFYRFLGPRLAARKLGHLNLREQSWKSD